jgi:hypothetical protein
MERTDLLIAFLALGAAVSTLMAWMWATMGIAGGQRVRATAAAGPAAGMPAPGIEQN